MKVSPRIGYSLGPLLSMDEVLSCAKMADSSNSVDSIWVPESWGREAFASLGAISQVNSRCRLGTSVINIYSRTPATVAMASTTLDLLSSSRTVIGLGASTEAIVENLHGLKFDKPVEKMKEFVECLNEMTSGEKVNYHGKFFNVTNFRLLHKPIREHIPIFIGAVNKRMISLACEVADGVLLYLRPLEELKKTVASISRENKAKNFEIACSFICAVSNHDPEKARSRAAKTLAFYVSVGKYYSRFLSENGFGGEVEQITEEYRKNGGDAAAVFVTDKMIESLTICGTSEECRSALLKFIDAGITLPIIQVNPVENPESSFRELLSTF
ncbi:MAG: LLM class flavin-dependent oxidoreductase [Nitrososphaera sp.]|nr:LLM class flavin-dependent oxidoreductase [Nitrososphaera sp.]